MKNAIKVLFIVFSIVLSGCLENSNSTKNTKNEISKNIYNEKNN